MLPLRLAPHQPKAVGLGVTEEVPAGLSLADALDLDDIAVRVKRDRFAQFEAGSVAFDDPRALATRVHARQPNRARVRVRLEKNGKLIDDDNRTFWNARTGSCPPDSPSALKAKPLKITHECAYYAGRGGPPDPENCGTEIGLIEWWNQNMAALISASAHRITAYSLIIGAIGGSIGNSCALYG